MKKEDERREFPKSFDTFEDICNACYLGNKKHLVISANFTTKTFHMGHLPILGLVFLIILQNYSVKADVGGSGGVGENRYPNIDLSLSSHDELAAVIIRAARPTTGVEDTEIFQVGVGSGKLLLNLTRESKTISANMIASSTSELASFNELLIASRQQSQVKLMKSENPYGALNFLVSKGRLCDILIQEQFESGDTFVKSGYKTTSAFFTTLAASLRDTEGEELILTHISSQDTSAIYQDGSYKQMLFGSLIRVTRGEHSYLVSRRGGISCNNIDSELAVYTDVMCIDQ